MRSSATYLFSGGGTGGHLFPGIAVSQELRRREPQARIVFVGSNRAIESSIATQHGLEHRMLPVESLSVLKRNPIGFVWKNWQACRAAGKLIRELQPDVVIGLGGYASAPVVWAAKRQGVPVVLLEQNVIPGRTTRWLSRYADRICVSFEETVSRLRDSAKVVVTGNPVRDEISDLRRSLNSVSGSSETPSMKQNLLILGGSQGADSLNEAVLAAVRQNKELIGNWGIIHQTGPRQIDQVRGAYSQAGLNAIVEPFFVDLVSHYSNAGLIISRAGATTLAELACAGVASILLPYPHAANDHQRENARVFVTHDAGLMIEHHQMPEETARQVADALRQLMADVERRRIMGAAAQKLAHPEAAKTIADQILGIAGRA